MFWDKFAPEFCLKQDKRFKLVNVTYNKIYISSETAVKNVKNIKMNHLNPFFHIWTWETSVETKKMYNSS